MGGEAQVQDSHGWKRPWWWGMLRPGDPCNQKSPWQAGAQAWDLCEWRWPLGVGVQARDPSSLARA